MLHARTGPAETAAKLMLEFVPVAPEASTFPALLLRNAPLPKVEVTVYGPPKWTKSSHDRRTGPHQRPHALGRPLHHRGRPFRGAAGSGDGRLRAYPPCLDRELRYHAGRARPEPLLLNNSRRLKIRVGFPTAHAFIRGTSEIFRFPARVSHSFAPSPPFQQSS